MKTILICDDDDLLRDFYGRVLEAKGYKVVSAENGAIGLEKINANPSEISLAIVDLLMPVMNGWDLINKLQNNDDTKNIPIIAITGLSSSREDFQKVKESCCEIINKGEFDLAQFLSFVEKYSI